MRIVGIDLGKKRVGLAYGNDALGVVIPLEPYLVDQNLLDEIDRLLEMVAEHEPKLLVIGDPLTLEGEKGIAHVWVHEIGDAIAAKFGGDLCYIDERLTTAKATNLLREAGLSTRKMRSRVDSVAAAVILQHYVDSRTTSR